MRIPDQNDYGTRECPSCACEVEANNNHCPICGYAFPSHSPARRGLRIWGSLILALILLALTIGLW